MELTKISIGEDTDKLVSRINTCLIYINACRTRLGILRLKYELCKISLSELNQGYHETLMTIVREGAEVRAYVERINQEQITNTLLARTKETLDLVQYEIEESKEILVSTDKNNFDSLLMSSFL